MLNKNVGFMQKKINLFLLFWALITVFSIVPVIGMELKKNDNLLPQLIETLPIDLDKYIANLSSLPSNEAYKDIAYVSSWGPIQSKHTKFSPNKKDLFLKFSNQKELLVELNSNQSTVYKKYSAKENTNSYHFSPKGTFLLTFYDKTKLSLLNVNTKKSIEFLGVTKAGFTNDESKLFIRNEDESALVINPHTSELLLEFKNVSNFFISAYNNQVLIMEAKKFKLFDLNFKKEVNSIIFNKEPIEMAYLFSNDTLFLQEKDNSLKIINMNNSNVIKSYEKVEDFLVSPDGNYVVINFFDKPSQLIHFNSMQILKSFDARGIEFSDDDNYLFFRDSNDTVCLIYLPTLKEVIYSNVTGFLFSPQSKKLALERYDSEGFLFTEIINLSTMSSITTIPVCTSHIHSSFSNNGEWFSYANDENILCLLHLPTMRLITFEKGCSIKFSPDHNYMLVVDYDFYHFGTLYSLKIINQLNNLTFKQALFLQELHSYLHKQTTPKRTESGNEIWNSLSQEIRSSISQRIKMILKDREDKKKKIAIQQEKMREESKSSYCEIQ